MKSKTYTQSKRPLDENQSSKFCQSGVKQTHFQYLKEKRKCFFFFNHRGTLSWIKGNFALGLKVRELKPVANFPLKDLFNRKPNNMYKRSFIICSQGDALINVCVYDSTDRDSLTQVSMASQFMPSRNNQRQSHNNLLQRSCHFIHHST